MSPTPDARPRAVIFGCSGLRLTAAERRFFRDADPLGFILFARNCGEPDQIRGLAAELREAVGRADAPILIDQEGGRVQRLKPPRWRHAPPAAAFGRLWRADPEAAREAARLNARLIAAELADLGVDVDCLPCLDVPAPDGHAVISDRAFSDDPEIVAALGRAAAEGLAAGGVLPVIKHIPGHGRARADSHHELPVVDAPRAALEAVDFAPFRALCDLPLGMTAHVIYTALDAAEPASASATVIDEVIRRGIGFDGLLMCDDIGMRALSGDFAARTRAVLAAGCDLALHCSGDLAEMTAVADACDALSSAAAGRWARAAAARRRPDDADLAAAAARLDALLAQAAVA